MAMVMMSLFMVVTVMDAIVLVAVVAGCASKSQLSALSAEPVFVMQ